jgi:sugar lactone lactonase YvrE
MTTEPALRQLLDGGKYFEGPRWHAGRLWFVDCLGRTLQSLDLSGASVRHATVSDDTPCGLGVLPEGGISVLTMFRKRLLTYGDGGLSLRADLAPLAAGALDDMIVDGLGRAYVGDLGFGLPPPPDRGADGRLLLVTPDGAARVVAEGLRFPNGIAVSADHRRLVMAEMDGDCLADFAVAADGGLRFLRRFGAVKAPDGLCLDREGAAWVASFAEDAFLRIDQEGRERQRIPVPGRRAVACALGGPERRTLFCLSAETSHEDLPQGRSSARIDVIDVDCPGAGYP